MLGVMEDFESTPEFQALIVAAAGKPERSMGDSVIPAEPPQWKDVRTMARALVERAPTQLAVHVYLIQAETSVNGFPGFSQSLQTLVTLLQNQWDEIHPEPDLDDPDDMYYARVNLINELTEQPRFLDAIHRQALVSVRGIGDFSARDIDIATGALVGSEEDQARCQEGLIRGAFAETSAEDLQLMCDALDALPMLCRSVEALFADNAGQQNVVSLDRLIKRIEGCRADFHEYADEYLTASQEEQTVAVVPETSPGSSDPSVADTSQPSRVSTLGSRGSVMASFDAVLLYYQHYEPSSPVRVLTLCARDIVEKPFFEILQALAPARRDDLPALLAEIQKQPLASLLSDSFARFLAGETLPEIRPPAGVAGSSTADSAADSLGDSLGDSASGNPVALSQAGNSHTVAVISSRQQVVEVLQDIETFFLNAEPASPVPLIISDIRKLVPKRFAELIVEFSRLLPESTALSEE